MTDAEALRADRADWTAQHRATYLESGGAQGHVLDLSDVGGRSFTTHCLIRYTGGRKSGQSYITPLIYGNAGGEIVVVASKGGADSHPAWYLNVLSQQTLGGVQIATQAFEPRGASRRATNGIRCGSTCATCIRRISPISSPRADGSRSSC